MRGDKHSREEIRLFEDGAKFKLGRGFALFNTHPGLDTPRVENNLLVSLLQHSKEAIAIRLPAPTLKRRQLIELAYTPKQYALGIECLAGVERVKK